MKEWCGLEDEDVVDDRSEWIVVGAQIDELNQVDEGDSLKYR